jgi:hypothetical protein
LFAGAQALNVGQGLLRNTSLKHSGWRGTNSDPADLRPATFQARATSLRNCSLMIIAVDDIPKMG